MTFDPKELIERFVVISRHWAGADPALVEDLSETMVGIAKSAVLLLAPAETDPENFDYDSFIASQSEEFGTWVNAMIFAADAILDDALGAVVEAEVPDEQRREYAEIGRQARLLSPDGSAGVLALAGLASPPSLEGLN